MAAAIFLAATLLFFFPIFQGLTFSLTAAAQSRGYPWRAWTSGHAFYPQTDQANLNFPWNSFLRRSLAQGELPWWNPLSFGGQPFAATGAFYPPRLLAVRLFPAGWDHDLFCIVHVFASGLCMWLLARQLGQGVLAAGLAGLSWMFGTFNLAWMHLEVVQPAAVFLPLGLLCARRAILDPGWRTALVTPALAVFLLGGHLPFLGLTFLVIGGYAVAVALHAARGRKGAAAPARRMIAMRLAFVLLGPLLVAAPVLLPSAFAILESHRRLFTAAEALSWRVAPAAIASLLRPPPLPISEARMHEMAFAGSATAVLALVGALARGRGRGLGLTLLVIVLPIALGTPLLTLAVALLPQLTLLRPFGRYLFLVCFAVSLLGGAGLDEVLRRAGRRAAAAGAAIVVLLTAAELAWYGRAINPPPHPRGPELMMPATPLIDAVLREQRSAGGRLVVLESERTRPMLPGGTHMVFGLSSLGGYDSVAPARAVDLARVAAGEPVASVLGSPEGGTTVSRFPLATVRPALLARLDTPILVGAPGIQKEAAWEAVTALPSHLVYAGPDGRAHRLDLESAGPYVTRGQTVAETAAEALRLVADPARDPRRAVVLERRDIPPGLPLVAQEEGTLPNARVVARANNSLTIAVETTRAGWLVVRETWDPGWQALLDGRRTPVLRADYAFRAVAVPPGAHRVHFVYRPPGLWTGVALAASFVVLAAAAARRRTGE